MLDSDEICATKISGLVDEVCVAVLPNPERGDFVFGQSAARQD